MTKANETTFTPWDKVSHIAAHLGHGRTVFTKKTWGHVDSQAYEQLIHRGRIIQRRPVSSQDRTNGISKVRQVYRCQLMPGEDYTSPTSTPNTEMVKLKEMQLSTTGVSPSINALLATKWPAPAEAPKPLSSRQIFNGFIRDVGETMGAQTSEDWRKLTMNVYRRFELAERVRLVDPAKKAKASIIDFAEKKGWCSKLYTYAHELYAGVLVGGQA